MLHGQWAVTCPEKQVLTEDQGQLKQCGDAAGNGGLNHRAEPTDTALMTRRAEAEANMEHSPCTELSVL